jgi:hypothetical protein
VTFFHARRGPGDGPQMSRLSRRTVSQLDRTSERHKVTILVVWSLYVDIDVTCLTQGRGEGTVVLTLMEVRPVSLESRRQALERAGLVHPRHGAVTAELFGSASSFFLAADKVQVKCRFPHYTCNAEPGVMRRGAEAP